MLGEIDVCWMFQRAQYDRLVLVRGAAYLATASKSDRAGGHFILSDNPLHSTPLWSEKCLWWGTWRTISEMLFSSSNAVYNAMAIQKWEMLLAVGHHWASAVNLIYNKSLVKVELHRGLVSSGKKKRSQRLRLPRVLSHCFDECHVIFYRGTLSKVTPPAIHWYMFGVLDMFRRRGVLGVGSLKEMAW